MNEKLNQSINLIDKIYEALNTLSLTGYAQTKTYSNSMEAIQVVKNNLNEIKEDLEKENTAQSKEKSSKE